MINADELAEAALSGEALRLRSLAQDWLRENSQPADSPPPLSTDPTVRAAAAGIVELLCERSGRAAPDWARSIGAAPQPRHLLKAAATMLRLRALCEAESPAPLRRRNLFAPADYLRFA